jgi:hypothetical protein
VGMQVDVYDNGLKKWLPGIIGVYKGSCNFIGGFSLIILIIL